MVVRLKPKVLVIEALSPRVKLTSLTTFLARSEDDNGLPRVWVGRLKSDYQSLIPKAVAFAMRQGGNLYNQSFYPTDRGFYCSELIVYAFFLANNNKPLFEYIGMNFIEKNKATPSPAWLDYYKKLGRLVPQGRRGSNPSQLSLSPKLDIIYQYGRVD